MFLTGERTAGEEVEDLLSLNMLLCHSAIKNSRSPDVL